VTTVDDDAVIMSTRIAFDTARVVEMCRGISTGSGISILFPGYPHRLFTQASSWTRNVLTVESVQLEYRQYDRIMIILHAVATMTEKQPTKRIAACNDLYAVMSSIDLLIHANSSLLTR
jgi:hypothetical protein